MGGGPSLRRETILIVDDDSMTRAAIATILGDGGYLTREADSGGEALRAARLEPPGLVLLDVNLPGMCGYEVCRLLRDEFGEQFPIVFVSGARTESFDRVAGLLLGANDYIPKPFAEDELLARVQSLLGHRHSVAARAIASRLTGRELQVLRLLSAAFVRDGDRPRYRYAIRAQRGRSSSDRARGCRARVPEPLDADRKHSRTVRYLRVMARGQRP